jgi:hypothetical protein
MRATTDARLLTMTDVLTLGWKSPFAKHFASNPGLFFADCISVRAYNDAMEYVGLACIPVGNADWPNMGRTT